MSDLLPRSTPADQGVDASGLDAFIDALDPLPGVELHSLMVVRHGHVVAERWWRPYRADTPHLLYSLSKSFTSTALGFAVAEGLVDLDATVLSYFPEWDARVTDPRSRATLVRHVAAMASGHDSERVEEAYEAGAGDPVLGLLLLPPEHDPGTHFAYNQPCTSALARIVARVSGTTLTEFLRVRLFEPLGIEPYGWWTDQNGRELGYSGLHTTTESVAKLGLLYLDGGVWQGRRLLPAEWVAEATRAHVASAHEDKPDWSQGYGFQFWRARHGYRGDGAYGQYMIVLPEADAVIAITSQSPDMQAVLDAAWEHLLPALTAESGPSGPWTAEAPTLKRPSGDGSTGEIPEATFRPGPDTEVPYVQAVRIRPGELTVNDGDLTVALGEPGQWTVDGPYATAYAWSGGVLLLDIVFVENPHRIHLTLDPEKGVFGARWETEPLSLTSAERLRMPR